MKIQERISIAKSKGLKLDFLIKMYGVRFVSNLLKRLMESRWDKVAPLYPEFNVPEDSKQDVIDDYYDSLQKAGIGVDFKTEPFIDEETGELVNITFIKFLAIR